MDRVKGDIFSGGTKENMRLIDLMQLLILLAALGHDERSAERGSLHFKCS